MTRILLLYLWTDLWLVSGCPEPHVLLPAPKFQDPRRNLPIQRGGKKHHCNHVFSRLHVYSDHGWIQQCPAWPFLCHKCAGNNPWWFESKLSMYSTKIWNEKCKSYFILSNFLGIKKKITFKVFVKLLKRSSSELSHFDSRTAMGRWPGVVYPFTTPMSFKCFSSATARESLLLPLWAAAQLKCRGSFPSTLKGNICFTQALVSLNRSQPGKGQKLVGRLKYLSSFCFQLQWW